MLLQSSFECLFRTLPDGRRVFYPRMWRGPGVQLRDAPQEAALRRLLQTGFRVLLAPYLLGFVLFLAPGALHTPLPQHLAKAAGLAILSLVILGVVALQWRRDQLTKDCPGVAERLTQRDYETCLASRLSVTHLKLRIAVVLLIAATCLGLGLDFGLQGDLVTAIPLVLLAAVLPLLLQRWLRFLRYKRATG